MKAANRFFVVSAVTALAAALVFQAAQAWAEPEDRIGRYQLYQIKAGNNDIALLLDSSTGRTWQTLVDATGKVTRLAAVTAEGLVYSPKDTEQLYSHIQKMNIDGLSTSDSVTRQELDKVYGYGFDTDKLIGIRDKARSAK